MTIVIGAAVGAGVVIAASRQRNGSRALAAKVEALLRARGATTLPEMQEALEMGSFSGRGKLAMALNEMVAAGQVQVIEAPQGTPQLEKVNLIRYRALTP